MEQLFSTEDVHARDRFNYWQDVACRTFVEIECATAVGPAFRGSIWSAPLADLSLALVDTDQCNVFRTRQGISRTRSDDLLLSLQLAGASLLIQDGRETRLQVGDFALYDTQRPYSLIVPSGVRQLVLKLPRVELERRLGCLTRYAARAVKGSDALGGLAAGFLNLIPSRAKSLGELHPVVASELSQQVLDLIALSFRSAIGLETGGHSSSRVLTLSRLKSVIEEQLSAPSLRPATAAAAANIGTRYANELLGEEGTSLGRYILRRRLEQCRRALADPSQRGRSIGDIAYSWGFSDLTHFGKRFREHFGCTPRDYRAASGTANPSGSAGSGPQALTE